ncbi:MAG: excinuclease ABC subunit UvrC [Limnochordia bacterium]|jgi:excinuclease ABC subunit C
MDLTDKLQSLPERPGVYLMEDDAGDIIYVGKARSLKDRVRSYFSGTPSSPKVRALVSHIADLDYIVTDSEVEALILECNLIKEHRPWYNVRLRDDKSYPYLKVTNEQFPRVLVVRRREEDGSRYFGPYTNVQAMRQTVKFLRKHFPIRTCRRRLEGNKDRPCLNFHIDRCLAPCTGKVSPEAYGEIVDQVCQFLEGRQEGLIKDLTAKMECAAKALRFEEAARLRDQINALEYIAQEQQKIVGDQGLDQDIIGLAQGEGIACVQVFFVREGKIVGREQFLMEDESGSTPSEVTAAFLEQYYTRAAHIPKEILIETQVDDSQALSLWLSSKRGSKVYIKVPRRGPKRHLVALVQENAQLSLDDVLGAQSRRDKEIQAALARLQEILHLADLPHRIEGYDISNIQGREAVGSLVVFTNGEPDKDEYRRFRIRTQGPDDYAMLQETVHRRFLRALQEESPFPDLILIDGGKGQLSAVTQVLTELELAIPCCSLAESEEEIYLPSSPEPLRLPRDDAGLLLLQHIRDEAHRFALNYHRHLRQKSGMASALDDIPGVGPKRKRALIKHFGSLANVRQASLEELQAVLPAQVAKNVYHGLREL